MKNLKKTFVILGAMLAIVGTSNLLYAGCGFCKASKSEGSGKHDHDHDHDHDHGKEKSECVKCAHKKSCKVCKTKEECTDKALEAECVCPKKEDKSEEKEEVVE